jgi:hypothetical protein
MKRPLALRLAGASLLAGMALLPAGVWAKPSKPSPSRLLVTAREFSFTLSKPKIDAGRSIIQLYNYGEDTHDLEIQRIGGPTVKDLGEVLPGEAGRLETKLRRKSRYRLWCSIPGHAELGMVATLKTSAKRPARSR